MRDFPRAARRRLTAAAAVAALAIGSLTSPAAPWAHADDLKDRKQRVEKRIDRAEGHVEEASAGLRRATLRLRATQGRLRVAQGRLDRAEARLGAARVRDRRTQQALEAAIERLAEAGRELDEGRDRLDSQRDAVADVVSDGYTEGDSQLLAFASFLDAQDPADLTRGAEARRVVVGAETRAYDDLRASEVLLVVQEDEMQASRDEVALRREEAAENLAAMKVLRTDAATARRDVFGLLKQRYAQQRRADAARRADLRVLRGLRSEAERIETTLRRRAAAARRAAARSAQRGSPSPRSNGYLSRPVGGVVTSPYGYRTHPIYGYYSLHDGIDFGVSCGEPLRAAASGRVVESYFHSAYGNRLILDHGLVGGRGLASIYNHASRYVVGPGQQVQRGQVIGYVGSTGWSTGCHLHFTVLRDGRAVPPYDYM